MILAFFFSLLQANWTYTGYDASAHVAEETVGARISSAWGVFLSVAVSAVVGYIFLVALTTHLPDLSALFPTDPTKLGSPASSQYYFGGGVAVISILVYNLGDSQLGHTPRGGHRRGDVVLRPRVDRRGRPDALRLQSGRRDPRLRLAQASFRTATGPRSTR